MSPSFAQLGVPQSICQALDKRGITSPFAIQAATIADALAGRDVCGRAPTGSGKTLAFGIPLIATVETGTPKRPRALVLAPTRELADQIHTELRTFAGSIRSCVVYGGVGYGPQVKALRQGVDIVVACPGRLEDLISQGNISLSDVDHVVIDEADRMADMGFLPAVRRLVDQTRHNRQTTLFSATLDGDIAKLTRDYQNDPVRHEVGDETPDVTSAHHVFWGVSQAERTEATAAAINAVWPTIVFCRTRHGSDRLAKRLSRQGIATAAIHGGRSQGQRTRALRDFADNRVHALIATDVAARGIHVDGVASVIHYDPPEDHKAYIHRSGRTARAGKGGVVLSLIQPNQEKDAKRLGRKVGFEASLGPVDATAIRDLSDSPAPTLMTQPKPHVDGPRRNSNGSRPQHKRNRKRGGANSRSRNHDGHRSSNSSDDRTHGEEEDNRQSKPTNKNRHHNKNRNGKPKNRSGGKPKNRKRRQGGKPANASSKRGPSGNGSRNGQTKGGHGTQSRNGQSGQRSKSNSRAR